MILIAMNGRAATIGEQGRSCGRGCSRDGWISVEDGAHPHPEVAMLRTVACEDANKEVGACWRDGRETEIESDSEGGVPCVHIDIVYAISCLLTW